jgi:hypothetical protein
MKIEIPKNPYLFKKEIFDNLKTEKAKKDYVSLDTYSFNIKYAIRTLNNLLELNDKKILKDIYKKDLDSGSWTIDITNIESLDIYFEENDIDQIKEDLIEFCLEWGKSEI